MFSSFIESVVFLTDAAFLSRYSAIAYDANGNAGLIYITLFMAMFGMSDGSQILTARRIGEGKLHTIEEIFQTNLLILAFLSGIFFFFIQYYCPTIITQYTQNKELAAAQIEFLNIRSFALFFGIILLSIQSYFLANGKTTVVLLGSLIIAISNVFMDYFLIFGTRWIPQMGIKGAALASTMAEGLGMLYFIFALSYESKRRAYYFIKNFKITIKSIFEALKIGSPLLFQSFISLATWTLFFFWIESMGTYQLTVSQNIRSLYFLAFIPIFGFAYTTKTYVSQYLGVKDFEGVKKIIKRILILSVLFVLVFFHGAFLYPEKLIQMINPEEIYLAESAKILRFVAGSIFIYSIYSVLLQTISGSGNTRITFLIEVVASLCYVTYGYLSIKVFKIDLFCVWGIEYFYFIPGLIATSLYLKYANWQSKTI